MESVSPAPSGPSASAATPPSDAGVRPPPPAVHPGQGELLPHPGEAGPGELEKRARVTSPLGGAPETRMRVRKRNGALEAVDVGKIVRAVERSAPGLERVDPMRIATRTISGLYDGATTRELDQLSIQTASSLIAEEPEYSKLAARLLCTFIDKEVQNQDIHSFSQSVKASFEHGLLSERLARFVGENARKLNDAVQPDRNLNFDYLGVRTVYDRYLLVNPESRHALETPQYFFLRVACGLAESPVDAIELYELMSSLVYLPSSPTLFNSGSLRSQLSSC